eukprot:4704647-Pyramimonas_sp.AAC.1
METVSGCRARRPWRAARATCAVSSVDLTTARDRWARVSYWASNILRLTDSTRSNIGPPRSLSVGSVSSSIQKPRRLPMPRMGSIYVQTARTSEK